MKRKSKLITLLLATAIFQTACGSSIQTIFSSANDVVQTPEFEEATDRTGEALSDIAKHIFDEILDALEKAKKDSNEKEDAGSAGNNSENGTDNAETGSTDTATTTSELTAVTYVRAKDGDTLVVTDGTGEEITVRLVGVDTPESVNPDETKNNEYGKTASQYTKDLLSQYETLYLQYDEGKEDTYGRTLAYVWIRNDVDTDDVNNIANSMLNGILVSQGYADTMTIEPNVKYAASFATFREDAKEKKAGLWQYEGYWTLEGETGF